MVVLLRETWKVLGAKTCSKLSDKALAEGLRGYLDTTLRTAVIGSLSENRARVITNTIENLPCLPKHLQLGMDYGHRPKTPLDTLPSEPRSHSLWLLIMRMTSSPTSQVFGRLESIHTLNDLSTSSPGQ